MATNGTDTRFLDSFFIVEWCRKAPHANSNRNSETVALEVDKAFYRTR
jgi:hypothetical protein